MKKVVNKSLKGNPVSINSEVELLQQGNLVGNLQAKLRGILNTNKIIVGTILVLNIYACSNPNMISSTPNTEEKVQNNTSNSTIKFEKVSDDKLAKFNSYISKGMNSLGDSTSASSSFASTSPNSFAPMPMASAAPSSAPSAMPMATASSGGSSYTSTPTLDPSPSTSPYPTISSYPVYYSPMPVPYYSGNPYPTPSYYPYSSFYGNFEEYVVMDSEEAHLRGAIGSYITIMDQIVAPIVNNLTTDARLVSSYGMTDTKGRTKLSASPVPTPTAMPTGVPYTYPSTEPEYNPFYNWQFTYVSSNKKEIYSILVSSNETLVLRQRWGLKKLVTSDLKIDSTKAIEILKEAVESKKVYSPTPMPTYVSSPDGSQPNWETIYTFDEELEVNYVLEQYGKDLTWNITFNYPYNYQYKQNQNGDNYSFSGGNASIDAKTGKITYLNRITKYKSPSYSSTAVPSDYYSPYPMVTPSYYPTATPTAIP